MDYDTWKCTPPEDYDYDPMEGYVPSEDLDPFLEAEEFVKEIIHHMYETGDVEKLEDALDELTAAWGLQLPRKEPMIKSKRGSLEVENVKEDPKPFVLDLSTPEKFNEFEKKWNEKLANAKPNEPLYLQDIR